MVEYNVPHKYKKRPIIIEAYRTDIKVVVNTPEGDMVANPGDYIITGIRGEKYPCKEDIFERTYDICE